MSHEYDRYLKEHLDCVSKAFEWLEANLPEELRDCEESKWLATFSHDNSKYTTEEYGAYDAYFYGNNKSFAVVEDFKNAWLHHIHANPHHWQHWVLINDEPEEGIVARPMPKKYVIEMICDWWAFSHKRGNLYEIFDWYDGHKEHMILHKQTRSIVEHILDRIKEKLDSNN